MPQKLLQRVYEEETQGHSTRAGLFRRLQKELGVPVLTYATSFVGLGSILPSDADVIEGLLQDMNLSRGLALIISSPGGDGLAAERIIRVCRSYSKTGTFIAIVPSKAKSAATMICMGAERIIMGPASELGPVDPQILKEREGQPQWFSAFNLVSSYEALLERAVKEKGNLPPLLQQLSHYDPQEIEELRSAIALSDDIAVRALASGMLSGKTDDEIKKEIAIFLDPATKKAHGRAIHRGEAARCGLEIEEWETDERRWRTLYELYVRTDRLFSSQPISKVSETAEDFWIGGRYG